MWLIIFELTILTYFPLNPPWNYFWHFLFGWFMSVTISQVLQTIYRKPCHWKSTFQCFQPVSFVKFKHYLKSPSSPFSTYSSLNILLTYSLWMIVSSKHFSGYMINLRQRMSFEVGITENFQTCCYHSFSIQCYLKFFLTIHIWLIVVSNNFPSLYKNFQ